MRGKSNCAFITAYERDNETNLDFAQARYFNSGFGRFFSPDDFLKDSSVTEPQSWNKYVYARNNPLKYIDPKGEKATVNIETDEKNKTVTIKVNASIVFYGEKGVSNKDRDKAAQSAAQNIANGWTGTFKTKDGFTVKVETTITYTTRDNKEEAENVGSQNVVGFTNGPATPGKSNSETGSGGFDITSEKPDYGRWNIKTVNNTGDPEHEFGHLLGIDDRTSGNELMNTNIHNNPSNSKIPTSTDFNWGLDGLIDSHRSQSRPTNWNQRMQPSYGPSQNSSSSSILRAGRIWWN